MSVQNFKIKHGLNLGDHELIDVSGNINLPAGAVINIDSQPLDALPDQTNQTGKFLSTDGSSASWNAITQYTPPTNQGGGNFLSGDGNYKQVTVPTLVSQLSNDSGYQTGAEVAASVAALVDAAPSTLNTLNELAQALGDDPNFAATVTNQISAKWTQDSAKLSQWDAAYSWGNHASAGYANQSDTEYQLTFKAPLTYVNDNLALKANQSTTYTKTETDTALALKADLSGGTFTGTVKSELGVLNPTIVPVGKTLTIPSGYQMVVDQIDVQGELDVQGTLATTTGGSLSQTTMKTQVIQNPVQGSGLTINEKTVITSTANDQFKITDGTQSIYFDTDSSGAAISGGAGQTGPGVYLYNTEGSVNLFTNNTLRVKVDSSGRMTNPYQPAFHAIRTNGANASNSVVLWNTVPLNRGNCYNATNGRFTAPVAGTYFLHTHMNNSDGLGIHPEMRINGVNTNYYRGFGYDSGGGNNHASATAIVQLTTGDYVDVYTGQYGAMQGDPGYNNAFCGYLLG